MPRYIIRMFSDHNGTNSTDAGTIVRPLDLQLSFFTESAQEAENRLHRDIASGKLPKGHVYQICPPIGSFEPIRSCAVAEDRSVTRVFLDPIDGPYGEKRSIRLPRPVADCATDPVTATSTV